MPSGRELWSDQVQQTRCVHTPKLQVWVLVRAHNSMIRGHFGLGMVWLEVTSVWGCYGRRSLRSGDAMIRGHFGLGVLWSEVTSVWGCYDQRSLRSGDGMIRGHFGLGMVWSEIPSEWEWSDQRQFRAKKSFFCFCFFCTERCYLCQEPAKSSILTTDTYSVWWHLSKPKGVQLIEKASPRERKFWLNGEDDVLYGKTVLIHPLSSTYALMVF